jgi:hypothetical protein
LLCLGRKNLQFNSDGVLTDNSKPPDFLYYYTRAIYNLQLGLKLGLQFVKRFLGLQLLKMVLGLQSGLKFNLMRPIGFMRIIEIIVVFRSQKILSNVDNLPI